MMCLQMCKAHLDALPLVTGSGERPGPHRSTSHIASLLVNITRDLACLGPGAAPRLQRTDIAVPVCTENPIRIDWLGVVALSQTEPNLPTTANLDPRDFIDLACWLIVQTGPISLNVTTPSGFRFSVHTGVLAGPNTDTFGPTIASRGNQE
jgi:hypothetical protein